MTRALLIIDIQEALCSGEEECYDIHRIIKDVNALSADARQAKVPVIFVQHEEEGSSLERNTAGWQLASNLEVDQDDYHIYKDVPDSFQRTKLIETLNELDVDGLVICGLQTDYCVNATTRRALQLGYSVELIEDAHSTVDSDGAAATDIIAQHNTTLSSLHEHGKPATLVKARDVHF